MSIAHDDLDHLARRRAKAKLGLYMHAFVFIAVNTVLAIRMGGNVDWRLPFSGWAVALAVHAAVVLTRTSGLFDRLVQRERERLALQRDPW